MKKTLFSTLIMSSLCISLSAFADASNASKPKSKLDEAWDHIEDAGADLRDGVAGAVNDFIGYSRDVLHERPDLQMLPHLILLKKGDEVKMAYCRPIISQLFRDREKHPSHNRCDEALTKGSFNIRALQTCSAKHSQEGGAAFNLDRQLKSVMESKENYHYHYLGMFGTRNEYRNLFETCARELRPIARTNSRPVDAPNMHEIKLEELASPAEEQAPQQLNGTL